MKIYRKLNDKEWMSYDPNVGGSIGDSILFLLYAMWWFVKWIIIPVAIITGISQCCGCTG